jgi:hypothetical protein
MPKKLCSPGDDLAQAEVEGAGEAGRVGADAGQPDRPLRGAGQDQLDRHDPGHDVGGRLDPGRPTVLDLRLGSSGGWDADTTRS